MKQKKRLLLPSFFSSPVSSRASSLLATSSGSVFSSSSSTSILVEPRSCPVPAVFGPCSVHGCTSSLPLETLFSSALVSELTLARQCTQRHSSTASYSVARAIAGQALRSFDTWGIFSPVVSGSVCDSVRSSHLSPLRLHFRLRPPVSPTSSTSFHRRLSFVAATRAGPLPNQL